MFWNGSEWVDGRVLALAAPPVKRHGRFRDWIATLPIVLMVPALIIPMLSAQAGSESASLSVEGAAVAGGQITVSGSGMPKRDWLQLRLDGSQAVATVRTTSDATFSATVTIPSSTTPGVHMLTATQQYRSSGKKSSDASVGGGETTLASVTVSITTVGSSPSATPSPSPVPTPSPSLATPTPTPAPTAAPTPMPTPTPTPAATPSPTPAPTAAPSPTPSPTPSPAASATPSPTPSPTPSGTSIRVTSVTALLTALANNSYTEIVVANGIYRVSSAASQRADSLWIGSRFAGRTNPVVVRAETTGGVTFDGGGTNYFGGLSFEDGAHDQTWQGFKFANGEPTGTGVITFGAYAGRAAAHHITLRDITFMSSITSDSPDFHDHGIYFSQALGGVHDILIDGLTVSGSGGLQSALHFYHSSAGNPNAWNVTVRRMQVTGTEQAIVVWDPTVRNIVIEDSTINGAERFAARYEMGGTLTLRRVTSSNSGSQGFYSSLGANPPLVTFSSNSLN